MAHASKSTRTSRRKKQFASRSRLIGLERKNAEILSLAIDEHDKAAHLAKILAFVIAANGGKLVISKANLAALPATTKLQSMYDAETESFAFLTTMEADTDAEPASQIEVVQPQIEIVRA